jgi:hypothetical protein
MPFKSKAQQRLFFSGTLPGVSKEKAQQWADETPNLSKLPEHVRKKKHVKKASPQEGPMFSAFTYGFVDELIKTGASAPAGGLNAIISKAKGLGTMLGQKVKRLGRKTKAGAKAGARAFSKQGQVATGGMATPSGRQPPSAPQPSAMPKPAATGLGSSPAPATPKLTQKQRDMQGFNNFLGAMKKQGQPSTSDRRGPALPAPKPPGQKQGPPATNMPLRPGQKPPMQNPVLPGPGNRPPPPRPPTPKPPMPSMGTGCGIGKQGSLKSKLMAAGLLGSALYAGKKLKEGVESGDVTLPRHLTTRPGSDAGDQGHGTGLPTDGVPGKAGRGNKRPSPATVRAAWATGQD